MKIEYCHSSVVNIGDYDLKHIMLYSSSTSVHCNNTGQINANCAVNIAIAMHKQTNQFWHVTILSHVSKQTGKAANANMHRTLTKVYG
ncbi:hypothetical protein BLOT_001246 [Blomia tropicalis]|nr:hypothetical protein BLOT_001246 [Blomia tropicalis]